MNKIYIICIVTSILLILIFFIPRHIVVENIIDEPKPKEVLVKEENIKDLLHKETPEEVRGIYMTSWIAATPTRKAEVLSLFDTTNINTVVLDIKDDTGRVSFEVENEKVKEVGSVERRIKDIKKLLKELHEKDIYVVGRIAVFQDPYYARTYPSGAVHFASTGAPWTDRKGQMWIDPGNKEFWNYITELAKVSYEVGFDEIQFDYIRFPSDGNMGDISYPFSNSKVLEDPKWGRVAVMESFYKHLSDTLRPTIPISADIFGVAVIDSHDNGIGQYYEKILPYFDHISPMVYPSHFGVGYEGFMNPAEHPYEVIKASIGDAIRRKRILENSSTTKEEIREAVKKSVLRPWLQDFDMGAEYTGEMVKKEIQALNDLGIHSWLLWDASNRYSPSALDLKP